MKLQIFISQSTDFHFAKYRFSFRKVQISFRKVQIFISQSTDFHFAKYRFHFVSFRFAKYHFAKYNKPFFCVFISRGLSFRETQADHENSDLAWKSIKKKIEIRLNLTS